jgi:hypothetical protein
MISVGQKRNKVKTTMGNRNYHSNNIGHKHIEKSSKGPQLQPSSGIIENYSNSASQAYEPIKGVDIKTSKHSFRVEKPKKSKSEYEE